jgi:hypothetical protein
LVCRLELAESAWQAACENISVGCGKYKSKEWLETVRRWPPVMVGFLQEFLALNRNEESENAAPEKIEGGNAAPAEEEGTPAAA